MATQTGIYFKGRIGNIVGSEWKSIPYLRYMPDKINQSKATKQSGANMATASRIGAAFRKSFAPLLPQPKNRIMQNSFTGAIKKWLQTKPFHQTLLSNTLPYLAGFEFNDLSPLQARFRVAVTLSVNDLQQLTLEIPALVPKQNIGAPTYTKTVNVHIAAAGCNADDCFITGNFFDVLTIPYDNNTIPAQTIFLPFPAAQKSVVLVLFALKYCTPNGMVTNLRWMPSGIVAGVCN